NTALTSTDFNADGHSDIMWRHTSGTVAIWEMDGSQIKTISTIDNFGPELQTAATGDLDGDGKSDIIVRNGTTDAVWFMNGGQIQAIAHLTTVVRSRPTLGTADLDGDGRSDILWRHSSGTVGIWEMDGSQIKSISAIDGFGNTDWGVVGTGDFSGDGT